MEPRKDYHAPMHTAEHVLNQTMIRMFGCERSFSNHIERKKSKCDYKFERPLTEAEIAELELKVNHILTQNLTVTSEIMAFDEASKQFDLRKIPDENPTQVRIVKVGDYDTCPCIGEHVANTAEVGTFRISTVSFEDGVLRLRYKLEN